MLKDIQELAKTALKDADAFYQRLSSRMEHRYMADASQMQKERERLEAYIDGIEDSLLRQLFTLRFVNGLPWEQSAFSLWGASGRGETARKMCYRYLKDDKST